MVERSTWSRSSETDASYPVPPSCGRRSLADEWLVALERERGERDDLRRTGRRGATRPCCGRTGGGILLTVGEPMGRSGIGS